MKVLTNVFFPITEKCEKKEKKKILRRTEKKNPELARLENSHLL